MTPSLGGFRLPFGGRDDPEGDDAGGVRLPFRDRDDAGALLGAAVAARLAADGTAPDIVVVLGVPRGGVVVAAAVARAVGATLDVLVAHKISGPWDPEFALGAVTADGTTVVEPWAGREAGMDEEALASLAQVEIGLAREREARLRAGRSAVPVSGRVAVIVDDGLATGATVHAACLAARALGASRVVVAAPVASREAVDLLAPACDAVVVLAVPPGFGAVGRFYERFDQVADETVIALLADG
jgi:putative phosphoribosyl transferase